MSESWVGLGAYSPEQEEEEEEEKEEEEQEVKVYSTMLANLLDLENKREKPLYTVINSSCDPNPNCEQGKVFAFGSSTKNQRRKSYH